MEVVFYRTAAGAEPVREYLRAQTIEERARVGASIRKVQEYGLQESGVVYRQLEDKLWELKIDAQRVLYVLLTGPKMILLHAFRKASQKTPTAELETAARRMREVLTMET